MDGKAPFPQTDCLFLFFGHTKELTSEPHQHPAPGWFWFDLTVVSVDWVLNIMEVAARRYKSDKRWSTLEHPGASWTWVTLGAPWVPCLET